MLLRLTVGLSILIAHSHVSCFTKQWRPTVKFDYFGNWVGKSLPCPLDRIVFPRQLGARVHMSAVGMRLREIVLPDDGSVEMPENGELPLTDEISEAKRKVPSDDANALYSDKAVCKRPGRDAFFRADIRRRWASADNWELLDKPNGRLPRMGGPAIPHADRIPCQGDHVIFPEEGSFAVEMPSITQYVAKITHNNERLSETSWRDVINSKSSDFYINDDARGNAEVVIRELEEGMKGPGEGFTPCQPNIPPLEMCDSPRRIREKPKCLVPIRPLNHCWDICGGQIVFEPKTNMKLSLIGDMIMSEMGGNGSKMSEKIWWWAAGVSGSSPAAIQIIIVEEGTYDGTSVELTNRLYERIHRSGIWKSDIVESKSGLAWNGSTSFGGGWEVIITLSIVLLAFGTLILIYHPPSSATSAANAVAQAFRPYDFVRFENRSREGSLALGVSQMDITQIDKAFDNPMYATLLSKQKQRVEEEYETKEVAPAADSSDEDETHTETIFKE